MSCGKPFSDNENILSGRFCNECSKSKEREIKIDKEEVYYTPYHLVCVNCAKPFQNNDKTLFGMYCKTCGNKWEKERKLRQARLKKARGL